MRTHTEAPEAPDDLDHVYDSLDTADAGEDTVAEPTTGPSLVARMLAELVGSFVLIFIGLGALLYGGLIAEPDVLAGAFAFGLALMAAIAAFGAISGGHFNPAISLGAAITGRIGWADLLPYWLAQTVGAVGAAGLWFATIPAGLEQFTGGSRSMFSQTAPAFGENSPIALASQGQITFSVVQALALVAVAAAVLVAVFLGATARASRATAAVTIGLTLTALLVLLAPISGGGVNPIRATASALFSEPWALGQLWLFWIAPLIGAAIAGLLFTVLSPSPAPVADWEEDEWEDDDEDLDPQVDDEAPAVSAQDEELDLSIEPEDDEHTLIVDVPDDREPEFVVDEATMAEDEVSADSTAVDADAEDETDVDPEGPTARS